MKRQRGVELYVTSWLVTPFPNPSATARLVCVPHAGSGVAGYVRWQSLLPARVEWSVAQFPGRESRLREPHINSLDQVVAALADAVESLDQRPLALFGHSMGALVSFELARELRRRGRPAPIGLFLSGRAPPHWPTTPQGPLSKLPDQQLFDEMARRWGGMPAIFRSDPDLRRMVLGILRADLGALEAHGHRHEPPLSCPIVVYAGTSDPSVQPGSLEAWHDQTTGAFSHRLFTGDHFYLFGAARDALMADVGERMTVWSRPASSEHVLELAQHRAVAAHRPELAVSPSAILLNADNDLDRVP